MIDIIVILALVWATILGIRRGFVVQLCHLVGLYVAILIAPSIATPVGSIFMDDPRKAYLAGLLIVVAGILFVVWILAPLLRTLIRWKPAKVADAALGGILNFVTVLIIISAAFSAFERMNIGNRPRVERFQEIMDMSPEERNELLERLGVGNGELREFFHHRYVEYATLDASATFGPLAKFGDKICPTLDQMDQSVRSEAQIATEELIGNYKY